jgi:hypothetical protein
VSRLSRQCGILNISQPYRPALLLLYLPPGHVLRFVAHEGHLVVDGPGGTAAPLGHHPVATYVEFLAVVRVRERGVGQSPSIGADHLALRAREAIVQGLCTHRHTHAHFCL